MAVPRPGTAEIEIAARDGSTADMLVDRLTGIEGFRVRRLTREPLPGGKGTLIRLVLADVHTAGLSRKTWDSLPLDVRHVLRTEVVFDDEVLDFGPFSLVVICTVPPESADDSGKLREARAVWNRAIGAARAVAREEREWTGDRDEAVQLVAQVGAAMRAEGPAAG